MFRSPKLKLPDHRLRPPCSAALLALFSEMGFDRLAGFFRELFFFRFLFPGHVVSPSFRFTPVGKAWWVQSGGCSVVDDGHPSELIIGFATQV